MADGNRQQRLSAWLADEQPARFEGRILDIDQRVALRWGVVLARSEKSGLTLSAMDAFLAATAQVYGLTLVTRDTRAFAAAEIDVVDPWN